MNGNQDTCRARVRAKDTSKMFKIFEEVATIRMMREKSDTVNSRRPWINGRLLLYAS